MTGKFHLQILKLLNNELTTSELKDPKLVVATSIREAKHGKIFLRAFHPIEQGTLFEAVWEWEGLPQTSASKLLLLFLKKSQKTALRLMVKN